MGLHRPERRYGPRMWGRLTVSDVDEHADTEIRYATEREPTPPGAITDLVDRLHELYLDAGEPRVQRIATGIGRGVASYTTVHNVFRGARVPKWGTWS